MMNEEVNIDVESLLNYIKDAMQALEENGYRPDSLALSSRLWHGTAGDIIRWSINHLYFSPALAPQGILQVLLSLRVSVVDFLPPMVAIVSDSKGMGDEAMRVVRCWSTAKIGERIE